MTVPKLLAEALVDLFWRAVRYGETEDGDVRYYLLTKGTVHRLIGQAQSAGVPAAFRNDDGEHLPDPDTPTADTPADTDLREQIAAWLYDRMVRRERGLDEKTWEGCPDEFRNGWLADADALLPLVRAQVEAARRDAPGQCVVDRRSGTL